MNFYKVFTHYKKPLRGLLYMPLRWIIVPFEQIEKYVPKQGLVVDLGCGEGIMATLIAVSSNKRNVIGMDQNKNKICLANNVAKNISNLSFEVKDILSSKLQNKVSAFILSDFLHHLPQKKQKPLLKKLIKNLKKNGVIVLKEVDSNDSLRSKVSRFFDFLFYSTDKICFLKSEDIVNFFKNSGMKVKIIKTKKWFPGSTTLYICQK